MTARLRLYEIQSRRSLGKTKRYRDGKAEPYRTVRRRSRSFFVYCVAVLVGILSLSCTGTRRSGIPAGAQTALDAAIEDIDAGQYDKLYDEASDEWKRQSIDQSKSNLQTLRDKLGRARTRDLQTAHEEQTSTGPIPGHSVTVIYQTSFDRGEGIETFTLIEHSGRWALAKYYVSSSGLK